MPVVVPGARGFQSSFSECLTLFPGSWAGSNEGVQGAGGGGSEGTKMPALRAPGAGLPAACAERL